MYPSNVSLRKALRYVRNVSLSQETRSSNDGRGHFSCAQIRKNRMEILILFACVSPSRSRSIKFSSQNVLIGIVQLWNGLYPSSIPLGKTGRTKGSTKWDVSQPKKQNSSRGPGHFSRGEDSRPPNRNHNFNETARRAPKIMVNISCSYYSPRRGHGDLREANGSRKLTILPREGGSRGGGSGTVEVFLSILI